MEGIHDFQPPLCAFPGCGKPEDDGRGLHECGGQSCVFCDGNYQPICHPFQEGVDAPLPAVASAPPDEQDLLTDHQIEEQIFWMSPAHGLAGFAIVGAFAGIVGGAIWLVTR
jgi:hypothetical protein